MPEPAPKKAPLQVKPYALVRDQGSTDSDTATITLDATGETVLCLFSTACDAQEWLVAQHEAEDGVRELAFDTPQSFAYFLRMVYNAGVRRAVINPPPLLKGNYRQLVLSLVSQWSIQHPEENLVAYFERLLGLGTPGATSVVTTGRRHPGDPPADGTDTKKGNRKP